MHRPRALHLIVLSGVAVALPGCFQSDSSPASASDAASVEEAAIQSVISGEEGELTDPDVMYYDDGADGPAGAPIATQAWWRELLDMNKTVVIDMQRSDGDFASASVSVTAEATGLLHLVLGDADTRAELTKDFHDTGARSLYFERVRTELDHRPNRGWHLVALSGVSIASPGTTRTIHSVRLQAGDVDETITDVTPLVRVVDLLTLPAQTQVTVTVDTGDATDHVYLHRRLLRKRIELVNNGDGTFSGGFMTGNTARARHIAIDVLSDGTLYDDQAPYDNVAWGIPYHVGADWGVTN
jgi:hypothetical protein